MYNRYTATVVLDILPLASDIYLPTQVSTTVLSYASDCKLRTFFKNKFDEGYILRYLWNSFL